MVKLQGQAFDVEKFYGELGTYKVAQVAIATGLQGEKSLDAKILLEIIKDRFKINARVLEVGCGYGRLGKEFLNSPGIDYYGIDLLKSFVDIFRNEIDESQRERVILGNFLDFEFPFSSVDCVLFPWSVIGDFSSGVGQITALERACSLLNSQPKRKGLILIDIPKDVVNKFDDYVPGYFNVHERYDLTKRGLEYKLSHPYTTFTGRNREIIEISAK